MKNEKLKVIKDIKSQQNNKIGESIVDLINGDIVELRSDGIYFTRKIDLDFESDSAMLNTFEGIKSQNKK